MNEMTPQLRFPEFTDEWQVKKLGDLVSVFDGTHQTPKYVNSGVPFYSVEQVTANNFDDTKYISELVFQTEKRRPQKGDILMTRIGDIGTVKYIDWNVRASFYVSLALIKQSELVSNKFISHLIRNSNFQSELWSRTIHVAFPKKINLGEISNCVLKVPKKPEQEKIAEFLTAVDERIAAGEKKLELLKKYKKGVMQKIFTQQIRFKDEDGSLCPGWGESQLNSLLIKNTLRNKSCEISYVQSVSNKYGFVSQDEYFDGANIASKNTSNYFIINKGTFAYNPSRINVGSLAYKSDSITSIVSPLYVSFRTKETLNDYYLLSWFSSYDFKKQMHQSFEGSVRETLSFEALSKMKIALPSQPEQQKIATFLTALDDKIAAEQTRLTAAKQWKKGLLQRMFV